MNVTCWRMALCCVVVFPGVGGRASVLLADRFIARVRGPLIDVLAGATVAGFGVLIGRRELPKHVLLQGPGLFRCVRVRS